MNKVFACEEGDQSESQATSSRQPRKTYIPPAIRYHEAMEAVAGVCKGGFADENTCPVNDS